LGFFNHGTNVGADSHQRLTHCLLALCPIFCGSSFGCPVAGTFSFVEALFFPLPGWKGQPFWVVGFQFVLLAMCMYVVVVLKKKKKNNNNMYVVVVLNNNNNNTYLLEM
jgi:hypothetical protein